ncbi:hypothetical protein Q0M94_28335 (plasmid) [Deinococcus radiomollis]|uniref:hypothetical protein n=1 Tax=Deinococcus radiomollis TaxID=468916 RepID=UPI0038928A53
MTALTLEPEARPMPTQPQTEPPQVPIRLLRRAWRSVVLEYAYQLFKAYRDGWPAPARAHSTYGTPQEAPTPSGTGTVQVRVAKNILWFGLDYTASEDRLVSSTRYGEAQRGLPDEDRKLIAAWLANGSFFPDAMTRATENAFARLATASGLGLTISQGRTERRVGITELLEETSAPPPLNAKVRRRA